MLTRHLAALLALVALSCGREQPREPEATPAELLVHRQRPPDSIVAATFLATLKGSIDTANSHEGFDIGLGGHWTVDSVVSFVGPDGLRFGDVNGDSTWGVSRAALRHELTTKSGPSYTTLVHLGYMAAQPYPQYATQRFEHAGDSLIVVLGRRVYRIAFAGGYVKEIHYLVLEGD